MKKSSIVNKDKVEKMLEGLSKVHWELRFMFEIEDGG